MKYFVLQHLSLGFGARLTRKFIFERSHLTYKFTQQVQGKKLNFDLCINPQFTQ
jgi:hypothetical protein